MTEWSEKSVAVGLAVARVVVHWRWRDFRARGSDRRWWMWWLTVETRVRIEVRWSLSLRVEGGGV